MSFRKEKKFKLTKNELLSLKRKFLNNGMSPIYKSRNINSCYFDTNNLRMFYESEEGILPRKKIRLRWYGENKFSINKEVKISSLEGRFKTISRFDESLISQLNRIRLFDANYGNISPKLLIKFLREYYIFRDLRLTFDTNIVYFDLTSSLKLKKFEQESVMEIKTSKYTSEDYIDKIVNIQSTRFSKYCRGLLSLSNIN